MSFIKYFNQLNPVVFLLHVM